MANVSMNTRPFWTETSSLPRFPSLERDVRVDVAIIGAGITGLTAAEVCKRNGRSVAVIDMGRVGSGETSHTSGHLTEVFDLDYQDLIGNFGIDGAKLASQSVRTAIQKIESNIEDYDISCAYKRVTGFKYTEDKDCVDYLEDEAEAALQLGVPNTLTYESPLPFEIERAIRFEHQAQFHPLQYLYGLARTIAGNDCAIYENTRVNDVEEGEPCRVHTDRGIITADEVIVAANVPFLNRFLLHTKIAAYRTYALAARLTDVWDFEHLFWDTNEPYHYIRSQVTNGQPYILIGGADHKTGQETHTSTHFEQIEDFVRQHFKVESIDYRWSGQIIETIDGLPYIGRNSLSDHISVATGYSGTGLTFGTVAGLLTADLILNQANPWAELYDATRVKPWAGFKDFITENVDFPSHLVTDRLTPTKDNNLAHLHEGEGALVRIGGKKVAAYRDPEGKMHLLSPVCPHLGCYVGWNEAEKSWDCPCHGSRFSPLGKTLNGPAVSDLASEEYDENMPLIPERYDIPNEHTDGILGRPLMSLFSCPLKT